MEYRRDEHRVHLVVYHLVWTPKRRKAVLRGQIARDFRDLVERKLVEDVEALDDVLARNFRDLVERKCAEQRWEILELAVQPDHIHLFVRVNPDAAASEVVRHCKGVTSRILRQRYPELLKLPSLWTRSFFVSTAGADGTSAVSQATILEYVAAQRGL